MSIKHTLKQIRDNYVIQQAQQAQLPNFPNAPAKRYQITFSGRVQKVGFRLEVCQLANRLGLTGFCQNLENGDVLAELQGPENRIQYLLTFMDSLKRIKIRSKQISELNLDLSETKFVQQ